jgi:hypothetical protein
MLLNASSARIPYRQGLAQDFENSSCGLGLTFIHSLAELCLFSLATPCPVSLYNIGLL